MLQRLGRTRIVSTEAAPIGGGRDFPGDEKRREAWLAGLAATTGLDRQRLATLLERYGTTAAAMARHIAAFADERPLAHAHEYTRGEIDFLARFEAVQRLADIVMRRTTLAITGRLALSDLEEIAEVAGAALGWSESRRRDEIAVVREELLQRHSCRLA